MDITSIGIDLGKTTFHLVALNHQGKVVVRKKFYAHFLKWNTKLFFDSQRPERL